MTIVVLIVMGGRDGKVSIKEMVVIKCDDGGRCDSDGWS